MSAKQSGPGDAAPTGQRRRHSPFASIRHPKKRAFLAAYAEQGTVSHAARAAGIHRDSHQYWLRTDAAYVAAFEVARELAAERLEALAIERAVRGWDETEIVRIIDGRTGAIIDEKRKTVRRISNTLLIFVLKALLPWKYRERYEVHQGGDLPWIGAVADLVARHLSGPQLAGFRRDLEALLRGSETPPELPRPQGGNGDGTAGRLRQ